MDKLPESPIHVEEVPDKDTSVVSVIQEPSPKETTTTTTTTPTTTVRRIQPAVPEDIPTGSAFSPIPKPGIIAGWSYFFYQSYTTNFHYLFIEMGMESEYLRHVGD